MKQVGASSGAGCEEVSLATLIWAALGELMRAEAEPGDAELTGVGPSLGPEWPALLGRYLEGAPKPEDAPLFRLRAELGLTPFEVISVALALQVERDTRVSRLVARLQAPVQEVGPTLGLLQLLFGRDADGQVVSAEGLLRGGAVESGLLEVRNTSAALVEHAIRVPTHLVLAVSGIPMLREGQSLEAHTEEVPLPPSIVGEARRYGGALGREISGALLLRAGSRREARAIAGQVARALGRQPLFLTTESGAGLAPSLVLHGWLPVFERVLGPYERFLVPIIPRYEGPVLVTTGPDGTVEWSRGAALTWSIPVPMPSERRDLWALALSDRALAERLAPTHRQGSCRIAELGRLGQQRAQLYGRAVTLEDLSHVATFSSAAGLDALAEPVVGRVEASSLVLPANTKRELELLAMRCRLREELSTGLGVAARTRYRPGVRALFTGASGTGKTLASSWLATELGSPLYRVDVAAVMSKYIGETEKNLAQLLARAEHADVVLLFDEADSLFGKRTEVRQANDRFANTQTNYLLQRMESYDGIVILTSNHRGRFDPAFTRRLDFVIDFPEPGPEQRRELWMAHLGERHALTPQQINQLSVAADLCGGHVRNVVLCAAVLAQRDGREISWADVHEGLSVEYRKLGKQVPSALRAVPAAQHGGNGARRTASWRGPSGEG